MATGKIKFYDPAKKWGFVIPDEKGKDIFFHHTGIKEGNVVADAEVEYELKDHPKGAIAVNIIVKSEPKN